MTDIKAAGTSMLGDRPVTRLGYGAMQLAGPGVFGPPRDHQEALTVLRTAIEAGVDHIDTSDFYGPHVTNQLIKEALHPYPENLTIVTKVGAYRKEDKSWNPDVSKEGLTRSVHDNLRNLGLDALDVVNLRCWGDGHGPAEGILAEPLGITEIAFCANEALGFRTAIGHAELAEGAGLQPLNVWAVMPPSNPAAGNQLAMSARALLPAESMALLQAREMKQAPWRARRSSRRRSLRSSR